MSGVDSIEVVTGYRIEDKDVLKYDLNKFDVVDLVKRFILNQILTEDQIVFILERKNKKYINFIF